MKGKLADWPASPVIEGLQAEIGCLKLALISTNS
jgi:hypothetical protein